MEDRYLFRGKDIKSGLLVIGFYSSCPEGIPEDGITLLHYITNINNNVFVVYPETVGQCTGLKDKNGTLIFEGDILDGTWATPNDPMKVLVQWYGIHAGFNLMGLNTEAFEIIGNAHDPQGAERGTE